jgi:hypothetical protein
MRPHPQPEPETPPIDRAKVRAILGEANALREAGVNLHHHQILEELTEASGHPLAMYIFAFTVGATPLSSAKLDEFADGLLKGRASPRG